MSHTLEFETTITNVDALVRALKRMDVSENLIEVHETAQRLRTFHENENKRAHVIVRRFLQKGNNWKGKHSDIGWEFNKEGVLIGHIDEFEYDDNPCYDHEWQTKLYTYCEVEAAKIAFEKQGMPYVEKTDKQGRIELRAKFAKAQENKNRAKTYTKVQA
jgi:hypothetical protein